MPTDSRVIFALKNFVLFQFSMTCPLITPAGTLFCAVKHFVDRHNLMYVYKRSKINKNVHETAIGYAVLRFGAVKYEMRVFKIKKT